MIDLHRLLEQIHDDMNASSRGGFRPDEVEGLVRKAAETVTVREDARKMAGSEERNAPRRRTTGFGQYSR